MTDTLRRADHRPAPRVGEAWLLFGHTSFSLLQRAVQSFRAARQVKLRTRYHPDKLTINFMSELHARRQNYKGIRPRWLFEIVRDAQALVGEIALGIVRTNNDIRTRLERHRPSTPCEHLVVAGLVSRAQQELDKPVMPGLAASLELHVQRAAGMLRRRYSEHWTLARLAKEVGTNRFDLWSGFKRVFGISPHDYLIHQRTEVARERISQGEKVEAAATNVGFRSKSCLYRAISKAYGMTPTQFRTGGR